MIEVLEGKVWRPAAKPPARLLETDWIVLRGFEPGRAVRFGPVATVSDASGRVELRPCEHELLDCHIGLLRIESEEWSGEIEILPGKMTLEAYTRLRADLEATWTGLALDQGSPTAVRARGEPDALALWRQLAPAIDAIRREPLQRLGAVTAYLRLERVKKTGELTPAVLIAGRKGLSARTRVVGPALAAVEHAFVADTLRRLIVLARRQPGAGIVAAQAVPWLRESPLNATGPDSAHAGSATHSVRHDRRLRLIQRVRWALDHQAATLTEGPGELRSGVRGLNRLYESSSLRTVSRSHGRPLSPRPHTVGSIIEPATAGRFRNAPLRPRSALDSVAPPGPMPHHAARSRRDLPSLHGRIVVRPDLVTQQDRCRTGPCSTAGPLPDLTLLYNRIVAGLDRMTQQARCPTFPCYTTRSLRDPTFSLSAFSMITLACLITSPPVFTIRS